MNGWLIAAFVGVVIGVVLEGYEHWDEYKEKGLKPIWPKIGFVVLVVALVGESLLESWIGEYDTARIAEFSPRGLSKQQRANICADLKRFSGEPVAIRQYAFDGEAFRLGGEIIEALNCAKLPVGDQRAAVIIGQNPAFGITVSGSNGDLVQAIAAALSSEGQLAVNPTAYPTGSPNDPPASIYIGPKPID
jgi:hypothetical protein